MSQCRCWWSFRCAFKTTWWLGFMFLSSSFFSFCRVELEHRLVSLLWSLFLTTLSFWRNCFSSLHYFSRVPLALCLDFKDLLITVTWIRFSIFLFTTTFSYFPLLYQAVSEENWPAILFWLHCFYIVFTKYQNNTLHVFHRWKLQVSCW